MLLRKVICSCVMQHMNSKRRYIEIIKKNAKPLKPVATGVKKSGFLKDAVRAVLFDIYGTLFISSSGDISELKENVDLKALGEFLKKYGALLLPKEVVKKYYSEIEKVHEELKERGIDYPEVQIENIWMHVLGMSIEAATEFSVEYESMFNPVWPMPFAHELLLGLRERGIPAGIISNAQFFTPLLFEALMGVPLVELGLSAQLVFYSFRGGHAKPSEFLFRRAKEILGRRQISPENILYVGNDILNDVYPAQRAGFQTDLFAGDIRSLRLRKNDARCVGITPDITVTDLRELFEFIDKM